MKHEADPRQKGSPPARLLPSLRECIRVRHYSLNTEQAYVGWVRRFVHFHGLRHPHELGGPEVEAFLTHLATVMSRRG